MGLFRATIITTISYFTINAVLSHKNKIEKIPIISNLISKKINYCYLILVVVFLLELIL